MDLQHIPLDKLKLTAVNMRHGRKPPDVSDILPSVKARGVLVPLLVRPNGDGFEIVAGRRRYFAAKTVAHGAGEATTLPCAVMAPGDEAAALEASLIENTARLDPDEMTRYETFLKLTKEGRAVSEIAAVFGITELLVRQALALGNLLPKLRQVYRGGDIDTETARHLTMASKARQKAWLELFESPEGCAPRGFQLKQWLFGGQHIATDAALFPLDDYTGRIVADLFGDESYFADREQFWKLQSKALAAKRDALLEDGWADVEILETGRHFTYWEHEKTPKEKGGKVFFTISHRGEVEAHEGWLTRKEAGARRRANARRTDTDQAGKPLRPEITKAMQNYLELHRHAATRHALLGHPAAALRLMVAHAICGSGLWRIEPDPQRADRKETAESVATSNAEAGFAGERAAVLKLLGLPEEKDRVVFSNGDDHRLVELFHTLLKRSDAEVMRILAFVMAETTEAGTAVVEALGSCLGIDMRDYWAPDTAFFALLRDKKAINAMLRHIAGKRIADGNLAATAKVQKRIIRDFVNGEGREKTDGWLPRYMAFPFRAYTEGGGGRLSHVAGRVKRFCRQSVRPAS